MKRIVTVLLSLIILLSLSAPAFANEGEADVISNAELTLVKGSGKVSRLTDGKVTTECSSMTNLN